MDLTQANTYFEENVLHNDPWTNADDPTKTRALNNASKVLYRLYKQYDETKYPIPAEAIYEQALWLLRVDDTIQKAEQGVKSVMVDGMQISINSIDRTIAPQVLLILGRRLGRTESGRTGYIL